MKNYCIVRTNDIEKFEHMVNKKMKKGWIPIGGVFTFNEVFGIYFNQPMIRYKDN